MSVSDLFPRPRQVVRHDPAIRSSTSTEHVTSTDLPSQGYELWVDANEARLASADDAGRRYGEDTINQLRADDGTLPHIHIRDWPDIAVRGYMLDVSRSRVPTRETLARLVDLLRQARFNHLQLYVEHTFAYTGHEAVWREASPLTPEDLHWLDELCHDHGIELAGNQNCFGHMERWLEVDGYRDRAESPDGWEWKPGVHMEPTVLQPTPDNAEFVLTLVREQMSHLTSTTVNVGCDETFELGRGRSADIVAERGVGAVYIEHLNRILRPLVADGFHVQYWGDIVRSHPDLLGELPPEKATALAWTYEAPLGTFPAHAAYLESRGADPGAHSGFARNAAPFADGGVPFWVAPGTSSWNSLIGRLDNARANLLDAAHRATELGAGGLLITDWGDNGHLQPPSVSYAPLAYGGAVAWCAPANADIDLAAVLDQHVFVDSAGVSGGVIDRIGGLWNQTGRIAFNCSPLQAALCPHQLLMVRGDVDVDSVRDVVSVLESTRDDLESTELGCVDADDVVSELSVAIGLARHGAHRMLDAAGASPHSTRALREDLESLVHGHRRTWLRRSRPGGLGVSASQLERTLQLYD